MSSIFEKIKESDELIQISLLSEFYFCKRRCSLRLLDGESKQNFLMVEGSLQHNKVHSSKIERRPGLTKIFNLQVFSNNYGLIGKTDCVECIENKNESFIDILNGHFHLIPVEYKHGVARDEEEYKIQLCAQAICLEEMYKTSIDTGYIYFIGENERVKVVLDDILRQKVVFGIEEIFKIVSEEIMHPPIYKRSCTKCSFYEECNPRHNGIREYMKDIWGDIG